MDTVSKSSSTRNKANKFAFLIETYGDECHYCHVVLSDESRSLDHKVPQSQGGSWRRENLVLACKPCNNGRGDMGFEAYKAHIERGLAEGRLRRVRPRSVRKKTCGLTWKPFADLDLDL